MIGKEIVEAAIIANRSISALGIPNVSLRKDLAARIDDALREQREVHCRAICYLCRIGDPVQLDGSFWRHGNTVCQADPIRQRGI
jgi:hypothetical protein